jgi:hypothetical protein
VISEVSAGGEDWVVADAEVLALLVQKEVPEMKVTPSFWAYGLAVMMLEAGQGAVIGLMLEGAVLETWQAGALGLDAAAAAMGVVAGCQKAVPAENVTLSF